MRVGIISANRRPTLSVVVGEVVVGDVEALLLVAACGRRRG